MPRVHFVIAAFVVILPSCCAAPVNATPVVWTGFDFGFSKAAFADPFVPENQDRITDQVALTRGNMAGLYNAVLETEFDRDNRLSPLGTAWATDINNPGGTISASNWSELEFGTWSVAYGVQVGPNIVGRDAVLHLVADDIYLDIRFNTWSGGESGGAFSYQRARPLAAEPTGDYNLNGLVDSADFVVWRNTLGQSVTHGNGADGNADGMINIEDYEFWKRRFGNVVAMSPPFLMVPNRVVPEGTSILPFIIAALCLIGQRARGSLRPCIPQQHCVC